MKTEQGRHPKQAETAYIITAFALLAAAITIIVIAWQDKEPSCKAINVSETEIVVERKPLR